MSYVVLPHLQDKDYSFTCDRCDSPIYKHEEMQVKHYPYKRFGRDDMEMVETRHYCWRCLDEE